MYAMHLNAFHVISEKKARTKVVRARLEPDGFNLSALLRNLGSANSRFTLQPNCTSYKSCVRFNEWLCGAQVKYEWSGVRCLGALQPNRAGGGIKPSKSSLAAKSNIFLKPPAPDARFPIVSTASCTKLHILLKLKGFQSKIMCF